MSVWRVEQKAARRIFSQTETPTPALLLSAFSACVLASAAVVPAALQCSSLLVIPASALSIACYVKAYLTAAIAKHDTCQFRREPALSTLSQLSLLLFVFLTVPAILSFLLSNTHALEPLAQPCQAGHLSFDRYLWNEGDQPASSFTHLPAVLIAASHQSILVCVSVLIVAWSPLLKLCDCLFSHRALPFDPNKAVVDQRQVVESVHRYRNGTPSVIANILTVGSGSVLAISNYEISIAQTANVLWILATASAIASAVCIIAIALSIVLLARSFGINYADKQP